MELWRALVSDPLAIACAVVCIAFMGWAILGRHSHRWVFPIAMLLAASSLTAGIGFASLRVKKLSRAKKSPQQFASVPPLIEVPRTAIDTAPTLSSAHRIWILKTKAQLVEYDWSTSSPRQSVELPNDFVQLLPMGAASKLKITSGGQILLGPVSPSSGTQPGCEVWLWNGQKEARLNCGSDPTNPRGIESDEGQILPAATLDVALSADGQHLFWSTNQDQSSSQAKDEVITTFRIWQTDLAGSHRQDVASFTFPQCKCTTGVCEESCPQGSLWAPETGINGFLVANHFIRGQLESEHLASFAYREFDGKWSNKQLADPLEIIADASRDGAVLIEVVPDVACCGWDNESDDQTVLLSGDHRTVIFDERARFDNPDYDVSFSAPEARLSPDLKLVAMTITAAAHPQDEIRLAASGKDNPGELERIRHALADLPAVEIVSAEAPGTRIALLPHAKLVGWLSDEQVLIIEDHFLTAYDVTTKVHKKSQIPVTDNAHVFLR